MRAASNRSEGDISGTSDISTSGGRYNAQLKQEGQVQTDKIYDTSDNKKTNKQARTDIFERAREQDREGNVTAQSITTAE